MRIRPFGREVVLEAISDWIVSGVLLAVLGASAAIVAISQLQIKHDLDATNAILADASTLVLVIQAEEPISPAIVDALQNRSDVTWALGFGPTQQATNPGLGSVSRPIPFRSVYGTLPASWTVEGVWESGRVFLGRAASATGGYVGPGGSVTLAGRSRSAIAIGGIVEAPPPLEVYNSYALTQGNIDDPIVEIDVMVENPAEVAGVVEAARRLLPPNSTIRDSTDVIDRSIELSHRLRVAALDRNRQILVLASGLVLIVGMLSVALRRTEIGRRRALGATRSDIVLISLGRSFIAASLAAPLGVTFAHLWVGGARLRLATVGADCVLVVLLALSATLVPSIMAAWSDPVRVLRKA